MLRRGSLLLPLLMASACAEPLEPTEVIVRNRGDGGTPQDTSGSLNLPPDDTSAPPEELGDTGTPSLDTGSGSVDTGTAAATDSSLTDTATSVVDTGTAVVDTGAAVVDTGTPPTDTGATGATITFPIFSDTFSIYYDPNFWNAGDFIQGSRSTSLSSITSITGNVGIANSLTCGSLNIEVSINGGVVGTMNVLPTSGTKIPLSLTFAAKTGPSYVLKYRAANTVKSGCGVITINEDSTVLTLK